MKYSTTHREALSHAVDALYQLDEAATTHCRPGACSVMCDGEGDERHVLAPDGFTPAVQRARQAVKDAICLISPVVAGIEPALSDERLKSFLDEA